MHGIYILELNIPLKGTRNAHTHTHTISVFIYYFASEHFHEWHFALFWPNNGKSHREWKFFCAFYARGIAVYMWCSELGLLYWRMRWGLGAVRCGHMPCCIYYLKCNIQYMYTMNIFLYIYLYTRAQWKWKWIMSVNIFHLLSTTIIMNIFVYRIYLIVNNIFIYF